MKLKLILLAILACAAPLTVDARAFVQTPTTEREAQTGQVQTPDPVDAKKEHRADGKREKSSAEDRWKNKSDEERRVLLERFEELRKLSPEDREALKLRAEELADQRRNFESKLDPKMRKDLDDLPPHERSRILRDHQISERRRAGEELRVSLEAGSREMLEKLLDHPDGPPRPFHEVRDELRIEFGHKAVKRYGELGHLSKEEEQTLLKMSGPERMHQALLIKRVRIEQAIVGVGLPEGVSEDQWKKMQAEPSVERFLKQARKRGFDEHLGLGRFCETAPRGAEGQRGPGEPGRPKSGMDADREPGRHPGDGRMEPGRGPRGQGPQTDGKKPKPEDPGFRDLGDMLRPTFDDRLAVNDLPMDERREEMSKRIKKRVKQFLETNEVLSKEERKELKGMQAEQYVDYLMELVQRRRGLDRPERREAPKRDQSGRSPQDRGPRR